MIVTMKNTTTKAISQKLETLHVQRGEAAQGRVLTLIISCAQRELEDSLRIANEISGEHPCRVIALVPGGTSVNPKAVLAQDTRDVNPDAAREGVLQGNETDLEAEIRFGADAGASDVIVLFPHGELAQHLDTLVIPLMVADTPVVAWWPTQAPDNPAQDPIGRMAVSRITDAARSSEPLETLEKLTRVATLEDVDLSWTHLTLWRASLASVLDQAQGHKIISAEVTGSPENISVRLMAAWLATVAGAQASIRPQQANEECEGGPVPEGIIRGVKLTMDDGGVYTLSRGISMAKRALQDAGVEVDPSWQSPALHDGAWVTTPTSKAPQMISLPHRSTADCLSEELGRLYPDPLYSRVLRSSFTVIHG